VRAVLRTILPFAVRLNAGAKVAQPYLAVLSMLVEFTLARRSGRSARLPQIHVDASRVEYVVDESSEPNTCTVHLIGHEGITVMGTAEEAARKINEARAAPPLRPESWVSTK
jgi:hypothetical protein